MKWIPIPLGIAREELGFHIYPASWPYTCFCYQCHSSPFKWLGHWQMLYIIWWVYIMQSCYWTTGNMPEVENIPFSSTFSILGLFPKMLVEANRLIQSFLKPEDHRVNWVNTSRRGSAFSVPWSLYFLSNFFLSIQSLLLPNPRLARIKGKTERRE